MRFKGILHFLILVAFSVFVFTGCLSNPGTLTRAHVGIKDGAKEINLDSHKDTKVEEFERISPDGSSIRIKGYSSVANQAAIEASTQQYQLFQQTMQMNAQTMQFIGSLAAQYFSGGVVNKQVPATVVLTNAPAR